MSVENRSDAELVALVVGGDVEAFAPIVNRYRDRYARYATRVLGNSDDAEDVLQSAFIRAYRNLAGCRNPERLHTWLFQIVVNECFTFGMRRNRRDNRMVHDDAVLQQLPAASSSGKAADEIDAEALQRALLKLPDDQREAFVLKHVEELEYEEMAEVTGAGVSALKMRVKRACANLREQLEGVPHG